MHFAKVKPCTPALAGCVTQCEPTPSEHGALLGWVVLFGGSVNLGVFPCWRVMSEKLSDLSRSVILITFITLNDSEGGGLCPKVQQNPFGWEEGILEMHILFSYGLKVIFTLHGDFQMHPCITRLLAFCWHNFILIVLCKDF